MTNNLRLQKSPAKYDLRKFGFTNRVVNTYNSMPNWVVSANTTNTFIRYDTIVYLHALKTVKS